MEAEILFAEAEIYVALQKQTDIAHRSKEILLAEAKRY